MEPVLSRNLSSIVRSVWIIGKKEKENSKKSAHFFAEAKETEYVEVWHESFILQSFRRYFNINLPCISMVSLPRDKFA